MLTKETKLRIEPTLDDWLNTQAAIAGMAKTKYIIQALECLRSNAGQTHPKLSPKLSPESPIDVSIYDEVAAIKARLNKLEQGIPNSTLQFHEGQLITAQSSKIYSLVFNSINAEQKLGKSQFYLSNKLNILCKVVGTSKSNKKKLKVVKYFPDDEVVFFDDDTFLRGTETSYEWYTKKELAALKATAAVEPTNEQTPIEAVTEAPAPQDEPLAGVAITPQTGDSTATEIVLSRNELVQRLAKNPGEAKTFGTTLTSVGGASRKAKAIIDWTSKHDPEGKSWLPEDATRATWVMQAAIAHTP